MGKLYACAAVAAALLTPAGHAAPTAQEPVQTFRSGVDLMTVDVSAIDGQGRPVEDLRPRDFTVKVDGKTRNVVSAELVKVDRSATVSAPEPEPLIASNLDPVRGRRVVVAVDQTLIAPGSATPLLRTAGGFVDGLAAQDYAALMTFPEPGPRVDFTADKARVRKALELVVGQPRKISDGQFNIQTWEAFTINDKERLQVSLGAELPPTIRRVIQRSDCSVVPPPQSCAAAIIEQSMEMVLTARTETQMSVRRLESFLEELIPIEGSKTMVLVSAGLVLEDRTVLNEAIRLAAAARTSINVVAVDRNRDEELRNAPNGQSAMTLVDRSYELEGLETIADATGGSLFRAIGPGKGIFERLDTETSAWYVVAVERQPGDREQQRVGVEVKRQGVSVRANRTVIAANAANAKRPKDQVLREALSSPLSVSGLPVRVSTFSQRDPEGTNYRLHVAAQIGQPGARPAEYAVGLVVMDDQGKVVASVGRELPLAPAGGAANEPLHFDTTVAIEPGSYSIRFGAVDPEGRRGTVVRALELPRPGDGLRTSDLIVGDVPEDAALMRPRVEPHVNGGRVAGYLELYLPDAVPSGLTVMLEIAEGESTPALTRNTLNVAEGPQPNWRIASGAVEATLLPGHYVARASILLAGDAIRVLTRPFVLEGNTRAVVAPVNRVRGATITPELQRRTAMYVSGVVAGLTNVVAEEDFELEDPDRRVVSEFLLVQYPGSQRDLIPFRDVLSVNGGEHADRQDRLTQLFLQPPALIRERVRQISLAAGTYVPPILNPIFVVGFLQADFQSRFTLTVNDAGPEWPSQVKAISFVETGRPTLLRAGIRGDLDVPTRGTAWIEEETGRILQTELQVGTGRSTTTATTSFKLDERLQVMVPKEMRTRNPDGMAAYSRFRRFTVQTESAGAEPRQ